MWFTITSVVPSTTLNSGGPHWKTKAQFSMIELWGIPLTEDKAWFNSISYVFV